MRTFPNGKKQAAIMYGSIAGIGIIVVTCLTLLLSSNQAPTVKLQGNTDKAALLNGQWSYLAGASRQKNGLLIKSTSMAIVNQDGSGGQPNPPINLYGTYLSNVNNFVLSTKLTDIKSDASIQLYGQTPVIADEFRIERKSVRITFLANTLQVSIWDGSKQSPATTLSFAYRLQHSDQLVVEYRDSSLTFYVNSKKVGTVPAKNIFSDHAVWFGFDTSKSWLLADLRARSLDKTPLTIANSAAITTQLKKPSDGLQVLAAKKRPDFTVGAAMALGPAVSDPAYASIAFGGNFGGLTTENALKWQFIHPQPDVYTFQEGDALVALAKAHGMKVHGHTLVFGEANPHWVQSLPTTTPADKAKVKQVMLDHIATVVKHYTGKIATWDVVNEPLADYDDFDPSTNVILRRHKWFQAMGESYIGEAFRAAHAADPNAKLFMNEYGLESDGERWQAFLALVTRLKAQGVPIDGVGFQAHVYEAGDKISVATLRAHMQRLAQLGLVSRISEMDVYSDDGQAVQAQQYADVFQTCLAVPSCISFTTWGVSDRYDTYKDDDGGIAYGQDFLWSDTMQPTPATTKLQSLLQR